MAAARFLDAGAGTSQFFFVGQQGGGGQGRSDDAAISGSLASARRRPARSAAEPSRPVLPLRSSSSSVAVGRRRWRANAPRRRAAWERRWADGPRRSAAWRRAAVRLAGPARPAAEASRPAARGRVSPQLAGSASGQEPRPWSSTFRGAGPWGLQAGPTPAGAVRLGEAARRDRSGDRGHGRARGFASAAIAAWLSGGPALGLLHRRRTCWTQSAAEPKAGCPPMRCSRPVSAVGGLRQRCRPEAGALAGSAFGARGCSPGRARARPRAGASVRRVAREGPAAGSCARETTAGPCQGGRGAGRARTARRRRRA